MGFMEESHFHCGNIEKNTCFELFFPTQLNSTGRKLDGVPHRVPSQCARQDLITMGDGNGNMDLSRTICIAISTINIYIYILYI